MRERERQRQIKSESKSKGNTQMGDKKNIGSLGTEQHDGTCQAGVRAPDSVAITGGSLARR